MPSFLDVAEDPNARRHSTDGRFQRSAPRNSSVSSTGSNYSDRSWRSGMAAYDHGVRSQSIGSAAMSGGSTKPVHKGLFSGWHKDKSDKKKPAEKIVITSRHAAAAKTRANQQLRPQQSTTQQANSGHQDLAHMSAAALEQRRPHSGPVALHRASKSSDSSPTLTRIESHDEPEEEDTWQRERRAWNHEKFPSISLDRVTPPLTPSITPSTPEEERLDPTVVQQIEGTPIIGADLDYNAIQPKSMRPRTPGIRYAKNENGAWKR